jgi:hypothetical protein
LLIVLSVDTTILSLHAYRPCLRSDPVASLIHHFKKPKPWIMKKFFELTVLAVAILAAWGFISEYEVGDEMASLVKNILSKYLPWINTSAIA